MMPGVVRGVGVDAVEVERLRRVVGRRPTMMGRLWTEGELSDVMVRSDPIPGLAARFAAKEAVMKALGAGLGSFSFREAEVRSSPGGEPALALTGRAAALATRRDVGGWHLSLTHTGSVAVAVVIAVS